MGLVELNSSKIEVYQVTFQFAGRAALVEYLIEDGMMDPGGQLWGIRDQNEVSLLSNNLRLREFLRARLNDACRKAEIYTGPGAFITLDPFTSVEISRVEVCGVTFAVQSSKTLRSKVAIFIHLIISELSNISNILTFRSQERRSKREI